MTLEQIANGWLDFSKTASAQESELDMNTLFVLGMQNAPLEKQAAVIQYLIEN